MSSHYIEIRVVPDPEISPTQIFSALYDRLHLVLVQQRWDGIGISFPGYCLSPRTLGKVLRLHGDSEILRSFLQLDWLKGVQDHVRLTEVAPAPSTALHRTVQRKQFKTSAARLRRRRMKRKDETAEQAEQSIPTSIERRPDLPYVQLRSRSSGQPFSLFIALGPLMAQATAGRFNSHGLSSSSTVPWF